MASKKWLTIARRYGLRSALISAVVMPAGVMLAAEKEPIGRKIDNAQVMERVQLVGVIAGSSAKSGIAVIKDAQTGKTYAIKTGDILPGVPNIKLQSVQRELAVFNADGKEFHVRLALGGYAQEAEDDEDLSADLGKASGPGLFEKWYGSNLGVGPDLVDGLRDGDTKSGRSGPLNTGHQMPKSGSTDEAAKLREDRDGPVNDYLDQITKRSSGVRKRVVSPNADRDANADSLRNFNVDPYSEVED
jgi:hypothetical protein